MAGKEAKIFLIVGLIVLAAGFAVWGIRQNRPRESGLHNQNFMKKITITSSAFQDFGAMPARFTCDGEDVLPPIEISGVPADAASLAIILEDPDAPGGTWVHWVKFNMPPDTKIIQEGTEPAGISGAGTAGNLSYKGPCPPPGAPHRYRFTVYALDSLLPLPDGTTASHLEKMMAGKILASGTLVALYSRK